MLLTNFIQIKSSFQIAPIFFDYPRSALSLHKVNLALTSFETYLKRTKTKYAAADHLTLADLSLVAGTLSLESIDFDFKDYPLVQNWYKTFKQENPDLWKIAESGMKIIADFEKSPPDLTKLDHPLHPPRKETKNF